jgi:PDZ domain/Aspartyl protease
VDGQQGSHNFNKDVVPRFVSLVVIAACWLATSANCILAATAPPVPIMDEGVMLRVPVNLFNQTQYFVLDTGSSITVLDKSFLTELGSPLGQVDAETPSQSHLPGNLYSAPKILVDGAPLQLDRITCIDLQMARLITGQPCSGVLGMDALCKYTVTLDFDNNLFSIDHKAGSSNPKASSVPLVLIGENRFGVAAVLNENHFLTLLIDSGSSEAVSLNKHDWDELFGTSSAEIGRTSLVTGAGNTIRKSRFARLKSLRVGSQLYSNLICEQLANPESISHLGLAFLRQNCTTLDFPSKRMYLTKRSRPPTEEDDMSGLHLLSEDGAVVVYAVDAGSPAEAAGLMKEDRITGVDGKPSSQFKMDQIRSFFKQGEGIEVKVTVTRAGKDFPTKITLKRAI